MMIHSTALCSIETKAPKWNKSISITTHTHTQVCHFRLTVRRIACSVPNNDQLGTECNDIIISKIAWDAGIYFNLNPILESASDNQIQNSKKTKAKKNKQTKKLKATSKFVKP